MTHIGFTILIVVLVTLIDKFTHFNFYESFTIVLLTLVASLIIEVWEK